MGLRPRSRHTEPATPLTTLDVRSGALAGSRIDPCMITALGQDPEPDMRGLHLIKGGFSQGIDPEPKLQAPV